MRLLVILLLICFVAAGVVVGALNADLVSYDLAFAHVQWPKGAALLAAVILGWLLGGLTAWLGLSVRHRRSRRAKVGADVPATRGADSKKSPGDA